MKKHTIISRILALAFVFIFVFGMATISSSAAPSSYKATIYNTGSYKRVSTSTAVLRSQPKMTSKTIYITLYKGALIEAAGTVKSGGKTWYKIKVDTKTYYLPSSNVTSNPQKTTSYLFKVIKNNAPLRATPYDTGKIVERLPKDTLLRTVGTVKNKYGNTWYEVIAQGSNKIRYIYAGNVTSSFGTTSNMRLDQDVYFQTRNDTCSAAAPLSVLRYSNLLTTTSDRTLINSTQYCVGGIVNTLNQQMGSGTYTCATFNNHAAYERAIRISLLQGCAPIARINYYPQKYFNYTTTYGHYTTIIGIYKKNGETWLELKDSYVNRAASNNYTNKTTGTVHIPLKTLYQYGTYNYTSPVYLMYNP